VRVRLHLSRDGPRIVGDTNTTFAHTFRPTKVHIGREVEEIPPEVTVSVPGFPDRFVDCGFA